MEKERRRALEIHHVEIHRESSPARRRPEHLAAGRDEGGDAEFGFDPETETGDRTNKRERDKRAIRSPES